MKKFLAPAVTLGLAAALAAPTLVQAAPTAPLSQAPGQGGGRMQKMAAALGITEAQKAQMKPLIMSAGQQARAIQMNSSLTPQAKQAKLMDLSRSMNQRMMAILTPTQRQKLKAMRQQHAMQGR